MPGAIRRSAVGRRLSARYSERVRYAPLTERIRGTGADAWAVHDLAMARRARGEDVIVLSIGESDIDTPAAIVDEGVRALRAGHTRYAPMAGAEELRAAIAAHVGALAQTELAPGRVVFFPGAQAALFAVCQCILGPGDEVIVPEPTYVTYEAVIGTTGASIVHVPLPPERGFHIDPADVARAITPRTRAVLLTSPHNPTGAVMTRDELEAIGELCRAHDLWLVADEVYAELTYDVPHTSVLSLAGLGDRVVSISSLSKSHSMTGWRAGWAIGPAELAEHLTYLTLAMLYGSPGFVQDAALVALTAPDRRGAGAARALPRARGRDRRRARRHAARPAHARRRHVPAARRALDRPQRRRVRAPAARRGGRLGAAGRGLRAELGRARADLRDDRRGAAARGLPADRTLRRADRGGAPRALPAAHPALDGAGHRLRARHARDRRAHRRARGPRLPRRSRARHRAARRARARQAAAARGRGRRGQDRGREDARRRARRPADPPAVLRGDRRRARALRLELRAADARDPADRDRRGDARGSAGPSACTTCSAASSSCAARCSTRSSTTTRCRRCC